MPDDCVVDDAPSSSNRTNICRLNCYRLCHSSSHADAERPLLNSMSRNCCRNCAAAAVLSVSFALSRRNSAEDHSCRIIYYREMSRGDKFNINMGFFLHTISGGHSPRIIRLSMLIRFIFGINVLVAQQWLLRTTCALIIYHVTVTSLIHCRLVTEKWKRPIGEWRNSICGILTRWCRMIVVVLRRRLAHAHAGFFGVFMQRERNATERQRDKKEK